MPTRYWEFFDYVSAGGRNNIREWLDGLPLSVQFDIDARIRFLEVTKEFSRTHVKPLRGDCKGLMELRVKSNKVQYRPLCFYGPKDRQITILLGAIEKGDRFVPKNACKTALKRKSVVNSDRSRYCKHRFD